MSEKTHLKSAERCSSHDRLPARHNPTQPHRETGCRPTLASWRNSQPFGFPVNFTQTRDSLPPPVTQLFCSLLSALSPPPKSPIPRSKFKTLLTAITSAMIFRGSQLSHLRLPRLAFRQREPLPIYADRVSVSFNTLYGRCYITPISHRSYADKPVSRPKAHTGRTTTAPSKRAPTATEVAAKKKSTRAKKSAAERKAKSTPRRKTKSGANPKRRPETKHRKVLTKEQNEKLAAKKAKQKIKDNKITALDPPKNEPETVWTIIVAEVCDEPEMAKLKFPDRVRESSARYKALSPERREVILGVR